jgi:hypothetical protein
VSKNSFSFSFEKKIQIAYNIFRASPPTTPQRHRNAERQCERESRQMLTPEHRRTPTTHPAPIPFALAPVRLALSATPAPSVPSAPASVTFNNQTYHHLNPSLAAQLAALPPIPAPVRGRGRGRGRATNHVSNAAHGPSRIPIYPQVGNFLC